MHDTFTNQLGAKGAKKTDFPGKLKKFEFPFATITQPPSSVRHNERVTLYCHHECHSGIIPV